MAQIRWMSKAGLALAIAAALLVPLPAAAQTLYGSIVGTVSDAQGAAIPGATVTATNDGTGHKVEAVSNSDGYYAFRNLLPATYTLDASLQGFRELHQTGLRVSANTSVRVELKLEVGALSETVNVISDTIPTRAIQGSHGGVVVDLASAAKEFGTAADLMTGNGAWALHVGGSGRRNGDVDTPEGEIANTQSRGGFGNVGLSWTREKAFFGASYGYDDTKYGIPFVEDGLVELTPRRHTVGVKAGMDKLGGVFEGFRANFASRRYKHEELVGGEVGTAFKNDTNEGDLLLRHKPAGRLTGTIGVSFLDRAFVATGEEALSPPVDERAFAGFFYEELTWPHVTFQFGARVNRASFDPAEDLDSRDFTDAS
jgi:hypothetical protein